MRWKVTPPIKHSVGQERSVTRFLWLPKTIGFETRWLETASWRESYIANIDGPNFWEPIEWL